MKSVFSTLFFYGAGSPIGEWQLTLCGTDIDLGVVSDTVRIVKLKRTYGGVLRRNPARAPTLDAGHCARRGPLVCRWDRSQGERAVQATSEPFTPKGLLPRAQIGRGSEVRILGGRIIGPANKSDGSVGVHATGGNGGVHVAETDVIGLGTGVLLDASGGAGSNREVFITHATMDSDGIGLHVVDDSYVSVAGCWAASSDRHNVLIDVNATGAVVVIAGGTIFNGGAEVQVRAMLVESATERRVGPSRSPTGSWLCPCTVFPHPRAPVPLASVEVLWPLQAPSSSRASTSGTTAASASLSAARLWSVTSSRAAASTTTGKVSALTALPTRSRAMSC